LEQWEVSMETKVRPIGRVVLIVSALAGLLGPVTGLILPQPVSGSPAAASELTPRAYLPLVIRPEEPPPPTPTPTSPPPPEFAIYDKYGTLQDWDWLVAKYGDVTLDRGTDAAKVIELREVEGTSTLVLWLENANGDPLVGQAAVFYWPDAPLLEPHQRLCGLDRGIIGYSKENGEVGFGMGWGAHYDPELGQVGPHQVWVVTEGTDCLRGLGMLFDNHIHLDSVWRLP
jgi:hypothetical protein